MKKIVSLSLMSILLASCSLIPDYTRPTVEVPQRWKASDATSETATIPEKWWTLYNDKTLSDLVETASTQNLDIRAGIERVNQARAQTEIAGAPLYPSVDGTAGVGKTRTNPASGSTSTDTDLNAGLSVAYELDLFGRNAANSESARATLKAAEYTQRSLRLVTEADVVRTYFNLLTSRERVRIAQENLKNARDIQKIIQSRFDNGLDSGLELAQQKAAVSSSEAALASLQLQNKTYENALAVLLGHAPQTYGLTDTVNVNSITVPDIQPLQPSTLLERRPDIHTAEAQLIAANADIGAARAAFYPSITLGANAGAAATGFGDPATTTLSLVSSLAAPIFKGGLLSGGLHAAEASQRELVETYRKTVLVSFREVEDALAAVTAATDREKSLKDAMDQAQKAYDISRKRYEVGTIDFQTMLDTQATLLNAQDSYAQALEARLTASVDLVKALGGGWKA